MEKLFDGLKKCTSQSETNQLHINVDSMTHQLKYLNENLNTTIEEKKELLDEVVLLKKKTDVLGQKIQAIKNNTADMGGSPHKGQAIDTAKFVDINSFAEFIKHNNKELEEVSFRSEELKRLIDDMQSSIRDKITIKDVDSLQGRLIDINH